MRVSLLAAAALLQLTLTGGGCATDDRNGGSVLTAPALDDTRGNKRGNTPPGQDRSGGGPASGAILDPGGAVTKQPVLRER